MKKLSPTKLPRKRKFLTRNMAALNYDRQTFLSVQLRETIIQIIFMILATAISYQEKVTEIHFLSSALRRQITEIWFTNNYGSYVYFVDIKSIQDFWCFVEKLLVPNLYEHFYKPNFTHFEHEEATLDDNVIIGLVRIRQVRVRNDSCRVLPPFDNLFKECYADFSPEAEDTAPFGLGEYPAWVHRNPERDETSSYCCLYNSYTPGGYIVDLPSNEKDGIQVLDTLKKNNWINLGTRVVFINFLVYNGNINLFCSSKLVFEFPANGGIIPKAYFLTQSEFTGNLFQSLSFFLTEYFFGMCILYYILSLLWELWNLRLVFFKFFWNYLKVLIIVLYFWEQYVNVLLTIHFPNTLKSFKMDEYPSYEYVAYLKTKYRELSAEILLCIFVNFFHFMNICPAMCHISKLFRFCITDIFHFSIMFFVVFISYALFGVLVFGNSIYGFQDLKFSMFTLCRHSLIGELDYNPMREDHQYLAPIYYFTFYFAVFIILMNMFCIVINNAHKELKTEKFYQKKKKLHLCDYVYTRYISKIFDKLGISWKESAKSDNVVDVLRIKLREAGFKEMEVEMFMDRYNIDPNATISDDAEDIILVYKVYPNSKIFNIHQETPMTRETFEEQKIYIDEIEETVEKLKVRINYIYLTYKPGVHESFDESSSD